jgi:pimeloyl-ACP methyl ester carboxylesterase
VHEVSDREATLDGLPVFWREAPAAGELAQAPPLYVHGVPTSSDEWLRFLERTGGLAPDLLGFGRSGKPEYLDYTIEGYADFLERYLELAGVSGQEGEPARVSLVVHDWGSVGLAFAQRHPDRIARLVVINAVPFLPGYRWHRVARIWRTPVLGEIAMGTTTRPVLRFISREANATPGPMPDSFLDSVLAHFDQGTQRAILRLYRSSPPPVLAEAGARLGTLTMPSLVVWGLADPYIPSRFGRAYAQALPDSELVELADAGHWPAIDRPDVIERVASFLSKGAGSS